MLEKMATLNPDCIYHVYSRANGNELLFKNPGNYNYFLDKYKFYIAPIADTLCYCLMHNHFHFVIKIKNEELLQNLFTNKILENHHKSKEIIILNQNDKIESNKISSLLSLQFSHFLNAYAKAFNKQQNRRGNLFMRPYKRKMVTDSNYLLTLIKYIHNNPIEAGMSNNLTSWKYSSFPAILSMKPTLVNRNEVIALFDDLENFMLCHGYLKT